MIEISCSGPSQLSMLERGPVAHPSISQFVCLWESDVPNFENEALAEATCTELGMKSFKSALLIGPKSRPQGKKTASFPRQSPALRCPAKKSCTAVALTVLDTLA